MLLLLLACSGAPDPVETAQPGDSADSGPEVLPDPDTADTADTADTSDTADTADTRGETADTGAETADTAPLPLGRPTISPEGGGFVTSVDVTLSVRDGEGDLQWCFAGPGVTTCAMAPYVEPIPITASGVLRAQVTRDGEVSDVVARAFVSVSGELSAFRSNIPVIVFATPGAGPSGSADVPMSMVVIEPPKGGELTLVDPPTSSGRSRIHVRGSSSSGWPKQSWDMELWESDSNADRNDPLLGMPDNGDWILYAPYYYDEALIRNPLAFSISERLGRYAPRARFAEVFLAAGGQALREEHYQGVYVLMEEVERAPDRVDLVELGSKDIAEPEVTGGYLFKVDRTGSGESGLPTRTGTADGTFDFQQPFVAVDPEESELAPEQMGYLVGRLNSLGDAVAAADGIDPGTGAHWDTIMDVDSFIDHHIINVVMKNPDALRLSSYLYQDREGRVTAGPVWDFDRAAVSQDSRSVEPTWWDAQNLTGDCTAMFTFGWYEGLFEDPAFSERYWSRFSALLDAELSDAELEIMVDALTAGLAEPAARDAAKWGQAEFTGEVMELKAWLHQRRAWMRACIDAYPDPRDCPG